MARAIVIFLACAALACAQSDTVTTSFGKLHGTTNGDVRVFSGIPYAEPPVSSLRFVPPVAWTKQYPGGTRDATKQGNQCVSDSQKSGKEDCLYLNVYTPKTATPTSKLPVLLFIHGGSFVTGSANDYDCTALASKHNAIYVAVNYRLGSFGWLQLGGTNANIGLKDQREAIKFTKAEIAAFGGDPDRLMIFGESAGGISVQDHIIAKKSGGLFAAALSESGMPNAMPPDFAKNNTNTFLKDIGCGGSAASALSCLQGKSVEEVLAASDKESGTGDPFVIPGWGPTVDGDEFYDDPNIMLQNGDLNRDVTVVAGSNTDEGVLFTPPQPLDKAAYEKFIGEVLFGHGRPFNQTQLDLVIKMYPEKGAIENHKSAAQLIGDLTFVCGSRGLVQFASTWGTKPSLGAFLYHFDVPTAGVVLHASEIPYVFDMADVQKDSAHAKVAEAMGDLWFSFAEGRGPGSAWPKYANSSDENIVFRSPMKGSTFGTETGRRGRYCDFWFDLFYPAADSAPPSWRAEASQRAMALLAL